MSNLDDQFNALLSGASPDGEFKIGSYQSPLGGARSRASIMSDTLEEGAELVHIKVPSKVCMGLVGATKVCTKIGCSTAAHSKKFKEMKCGVLMVRAGVRSEQVFREPVLETDGLSEQLINHLLDQKDVTWAEEFGFVAAGNYSEKEDLDRAKELTATARKVTTFQTPAKGERRDQEDDLFERLALLQQMTEGLGSMAESTAQLELLDTETSEGQVLREFLGGLTQKVQFVTGCGTLLDKAVQAVSRSATENLEVVEKTVTGVKHQVEKLLASVGERSPFLNNTEHTLWGAVAGVLEMLDSSEEKVKKMQSKLDGEVERLQRGMVNLHANQNALAVRATTTDDDEDDFITGSTGWGVDDRSRAGRRSHRGEHLPSRQTERAGGREGGNDGFGGDGGRGQGRHNGDEEEPSRIGNLELRVSRMELKESNGTGSGAKVVEIEGHVLRSQRDAFALLERLMPHAPYVPFVVLCSPFTVLDLIFKTIKGGAQSLSDLVDTAKLKMRPDDVLAVLSGASSMPNWFTTTDPTMAGASTKSRFKHLPTAESWGLKSDLDKLCSRLNAELDVVEKKLSGDISNTLRGHPELKAIATKMVHLSIKFVRELFSYMDDAYIELNAAFKSSSETWDLVCFSVEQIFRNEFMAARSGMSTIDLKADNQRETAANVFWVNLLTLQVAEDFMRVGIKNHPAMSASHIRFVLTQTRKGGVGELEAKVKALEAKVETLLKKFSHVESQADKACVAAGVTPNAKKR